MARTQWVAACFPPHSSGMNLSGFHCRRSGDLKRRSGKRTIRHQAKPLTIGHKLPRASLNQSLQHQTRAQRSGRLQHFSRDLARAAFAQLSSMRTRDAARLLASAPWMRLKLRISCPMQKLSLMTFETVSCYALTFIGCSTAASLLSTRAINSKCPDVSKISMRTAATTTPYTAEVLHFRPTRGSFQRPNI